MMQAKCPWCMEDLDFRKPEKKLWVCAQDHIGIPKDTRNGLICKQCKGRVRQMVCPSCNEPLPVGFNEFDEYIYLTLVGPKAVGKTVYMTILTDRIGEFFRNNFMCSVLINRMSLSSHSANIEGIKGKVGLPIYTLVGDQKSVILEITNNITRRKLALVIQDTPGEIYTNSERSKQIEKPPISSYLQKADGILFLVDPLQMERVRNIISISRPEMKLPESNINELPNLFNNVLGQFSYCIKEDKYNVDKQGKIKTKLATVIMKEDVLESPKQNNTEEEILFSDSTRVRNLFMAPGKVDIGTIDIVSDELKKYLEKNADGLSTNIEGLYKDYRFFAVSALGCEPVKDADNKVIIDSDPRPFRIVDPIIWLLVVTESRILG